MAKGEDLTYWQAVSLGMEADDAKLRLFVKHAPSLGVGREAILRRFLSGHLPEPYRVSTGFVAYQFSDGMKHSDQCDVLVYSPALSKPLYQIEEFVVVPPECVRFAVEVRSAMTIRGAKSGLAQVWKVHESVNFFGRCTFGFGFDGPKFDAFVAAVAAQVGGDITKCPEFLVVHRRNYVCLAGKSVSEPDGPKLRKYFAVDFAAGGQQTKGFATAYFIRHCLRRLNEWGLTEAEYIKAELRPARLSDQALRTIHEDGRIEMGFR